MNRRDLLQTTLPATAVATTYLAGAASLAADHGVSANDEARFQYYEWRTYRLKDKPKQSRLHQYLEHAFLPTWKLYSAGPVGVFTEIGPEAGPSVHVLLVYQTSQEMATNAMVLFRDPEYQEAAADFLTIPKEDPIFDRIESWWMLSFLNAPKINIPAQKPRVLELRTYENHSEDRARAKVQMFNDGEIEIFPKCGFENVFFGECLIGSGLPCLKYMLAAPSMEANAAGWKTFISHPDFVRMRDDPKYANTEPKITKLYLEPTAYSQV